MMSPSQLSFALFYKKNPSIIPWEINTNVADILPHFFFFFLTLHDGAFASVVFLWNSADKPTNQPTNKCTGENIISLAEGENRTWIILVK